MQYESLHEEPSARILLVDDDIQLLRGVATALRNQGYDVRALDGGTKVLEAVAQFQPHLVVLDVMMPDLDGWEVLKGIRDNPSTATLPVIMLTAKDSEASKVMGFTLGADDYVTKPFGLQEFRCRVAAVLRRSQVGDQTECEGAKLTVVSHGSGHEFISAADVFYLQGIRNYTYVHTYDNRFLSRLTLGASEKVCPERMIRVHRSYIVHLDNVRGCHWVTHSSFRLILGDLTGTEIPVSRGLVTEVRGRLGLQQKGGPS